MLAGAGITIVQIVALLVFGAVTSLLATAETVGATIVFRAGIAVIAGGRIAGVDATVSGALAISTRVAVVTGVLTLTLVTSRGPLASEVEVTTGCAIGCRDGNAGTARVTRMTLTTLTLTQAFTITGGTGDNGLHHTLPIGAEGLLADRQAGGIAVGIDIAHPDNRVIRRRNSVGRIGVRGPFLYYFLVRGRGAGHGQQSDSSEQNNLLHWNSSVLYRAVVRVGAEAKIMYAHAVVN